MRTVDGRREEAEAGRSALRGKYNWPEIIKQLKDRPGQWLLVDDDATPGAPQVVRERRAVALRDDEWDFHVTTRGNDHTIRRSQMWVSATPKKKEE